MKPCIKCIESLAANFGARVVLSTATQPALESYFNTIKPREIIDDSESYVEPFRRCNIDNIGTIKAETLVKRIQKHKQCLCVVNEKDEAKSIYNAVKNGRCKNLYCLTTDITPYDRERLLRRIRQNLKDNEPCVVISTSLIESGVDVDFPCGYRELSSLDSILQTAGRVNRNGLRDCNSCTLFVFDGPQAEYHALKNGASKSQYDNMGDFGNRKSITKDILQKYDADSPKAIHEYFSRLYGYKGDGLDKFDIVKMANSKLIPFQDIGKKPSDFKKLTFEDELTMRKKLCNYFVDARWFGMVNTSYSSYNTLGKIEGAFQLSFPMSYDPIRIASISNTRCCVSSDDERKGNEKVLKNKDRTMGRFSVVEYGLYHMYIQTSTKAILRNGVTEDDLKLLIQTILHMFDDDMSSVRPSMTVRKVVVVRQNRNSGRVRPTDIEDAMVAKLKPGVNNPTSFNDYDLEFKRDMLPDSVEVKEYTMDNPEGVIL